MNINLKTTLFLLVSLFYSTSTFAIEATEVNTLERLTQQLNAQKGHVVYVDFWASWCIPCRQSFPWMNELQNKYKKKGLQVISINLDHNKALATQFLQQSPANFPIIYDQKGLIAREYKIKGMPSSFIIDQNGSLVSKHVGFNKEKSLAYEQEIVDLLND